MPSVSQAELSCVRCRARKIRCGREKEECANCQRDGVKCEYTTPAKRVNHVKLLCNSMAKIEERLGDIEDSLSALAARLTHDDHEKEYPAESAIPSGFHQLQSDTSEESGGSVSDLLQHCIFRHHESQIDRYYGPGAFPTLGREFQATVSAPPASSASSSASETLEQHMGRLIQDAGDQGACLRRSTGQVPLRLPAKQLFLLVQSQFFQRCRWATSIFAAGLFRTRVEKLYTQPLTIDDTPWVLSLHLITLLVLGLEQEEPPRQLDAEIHISNIFDWGVSWSERTSLMVPRLIDVQTLALLSRYGQQFLPLPVAESIHTQACIRAKAIGLHCVGPEGGMDAFSPEEAEERLHLYRHLRSQDIRFAILRGSTPWLLGHHWPSLGSSVDLGQIQEQLHHITSTNVATTKRQQVLADLLRQLDQWALEYQIVASGPRDRRNPNVRSLRQEILATRIAILVSLNTPDSLQKAIFDARIACAMLLRSFSAGAPVSCEQLAPPASHPILNLGGEDSCQALYSDPQVDEEDYLSPLLRQDALEMFSIRAFFVIAAALTEPTSASLQTDLDLLRGVSLLYSSVGRRMPVGNHLLKLGRVFESVLEIIHERRRQDPPDQSEIHGDPHEDHAMRVTVSPSLDVIEGLPNGLEFQSPDPAYPTTLPSSSFNPDALSSMPVWFLGSMVEDETPFFEAAMLHNQPGHQPRPEQRPAAPGSPSHDLGPELAASSLPKTLHFELPADVGYGMSMPE
ncbi:hypothetical protein KXX20_008813 [Aspergillus fumigatus]|nr:hypothetical protein KXX20_008813 [Aspergillus fumigatus]KAH2266348.1 hypothetical protein KXW96_009368 [Aspergillus fumigatus]